MIHTVKNKHLSKYLDVIGRILFGRDNENNHRLIMKGFYVPRKVIHSSFAICVCGCIF